MSEVIRYRQIGVEVDEGAITEREMAIMDIVSGFADARAELGAKMVPFSLAHGISPFTGVALQAFLEGLRVGLQRAEMAREMVAVQRHFIATLPDNSRRDVDDLDRLLLGKFDRLWAGLPPKEDADGQADRP